MPIIFTSAYARKLLKKADEYDAANAGEKMRGQAFFGGEDLLAGSRPITD